MLLCLSVNLQAVCGGVLEEWKEETQPPLLQIRGIATDNPSYALCLCFSFFTKAICGVPGGGEILMSDRLLKHCQGQAN